MSAEEMARWVGIAWRLDRYRWIPTVVLDAVVWGTSEAPCQNSHGDSPAWLEASQSDSELAARLCGECPVADACLELEMRTGGPESVGVWGGLCEDERREVRRYWLARGDRADKPSAVDGGDA